MDKRRVIIVTDGDKVAKRTVEVAARNIGARCISRSWGNPTPCTGEHLANLIQSAAHDPVVVMLDDKGDRGKGRGEEALEYIAKHPDIEILGVVAVASNTDGTEGVQVDECISNDGKIVQRPVDKCGHPVGTKTLTGDTVDILNELDIPVVVGVGDIGKMEGADYYLAGAHITTKALQEVLKRSGWNESQ